LTAQEITNITSHIIQKAAGHDRPENTIIRRLMAEKIVGDTQTSNHLKRGIFLQTHSNNRDAEPYKNTT
jgi:hypothetical protein